MAAGGQQSQLDALGDVEAAARDARTFDETERAALALTIEMTRSVKVSDATFERARKALGDTQLTELVGTIACYNMVSRYLVALGVDETGE